MPLAVKLDEKYTYIDYLNWPEGERWELIEGVPYDMSPAPSSKHQQIVHVINGILYNFLDGKKCSVFPAPFDVRFASKNAADKEVITVVQPDISVICDKSKIDKRGCIGAPDLIVEILSESTAYKDETEKLMLYEKHGVKEYWIISPDGEYVMIFHHNGSGFDKPEFLKKHEAAASRVLDGFSFPLRKIFISEQDNQAAADTV